MKKANPVMLILILVIMVTVQGCGGNKNANAERKARNNIVLSLPNPDKAFDTYKEAILEKDVAKLKATLTTGHLDKLKGIIDTIKMRNQIKDDEKAWEKYIEEEYREWKNISFKRRPVKKSDDTHAEINLEYKLPEKYTNVRIYLEKEDNNWKLIGVSRFKSSKFIKH